MALKIILLLNNQINELLYCKTEMTARSNKWPLILGTIYLKNCQIDVQSKVSSESKNNLLCVVFFTSANLDSSSRFRSSTCLREFRICSYILWACSALCLSFSSFISRVVIRLAADIISLLAIALSALSMLFSPPVIMKINSLG